MNQPTRPCVVPLVLAQLIDAAPSRVRKRLDKEPDVAQQWEWQPNDTGWSISTGEETVAIAVKLGIVDTIEALKCSCLLSPRCFHILACVNSLQAAAPSSLGSQPETTSQPDSSLGSQPETSLVSQPETSFSSQPETSFSSQPETSISSQPESIPASQPESSLGSQPESIPVSQPDGDLKCPPQETATTSTNSSDNSTTPLVTLDDDQLLATKQVQHELALLTRVGGRRADLLRQSGLLRAAHTCRAAGLVNLGNGMLRLVESARRLRDNSDTADAHALAEGLADALQQSERLLQNVLVPQSLVGQSRREFMPCDVGKLMGVCAEPVLTLSGYAGVVVFLQDIDSRFAAGKQELFSVNHARPGGSQWIAQSYRGGIDMGMQTLQAAEVCRSQLLVQNLTTSADGRLGKGTSTRWVLTQRASELRPLSQGRFGKPLAEQIRGIFDSAANAVADRGAGWDLIAFDAQVLGAQGPSLLVRVRDGAVAGWKLRIAIDNPLLPFRENLSLLARCPGLVLRCLGRLRLQAAGEVDLLAISNADDEAWVELADDASEHSDQSEHNRTLPRLKLEDAWKGVCNVGFERLQRLHVEGVQRWSSEVTLDGETQPVRGEFEGSPLDGLEPLRRRQVAIALGGRHAVAELSSQAHRRDRHQLAQRFQHTAVELLDLLAVAAHEREAGADTRGTEKGEATLRLERIYLANHLYLQNAARYFQKQLWLSM